MTAPRTTASRIGRYVAGLVLAVLLTASAFGIVVWGGLSGGTAMATIAGLAAVQCAVHLLLFLDIGRGRGDVEVRAALLFAAVLAIIMVGGTIAIMGDLTHRMMPP